MNAEELPQRKATAALVNHGCMLLFVKELTNQGKKKREMDYNTSLVFISLSTGPFRSRCSLGYTHKPWPGLVIRCLVLFPLFLSQGTHTQAPPLPSPLVCQRVFQDKDTLSRIIIRAFNFVISSIIDQSNRVQIKEQQCVNCCDMQKAGCIYCYFWIRK